MKPQVKNARRIRFSFISISLSLVIALSTVFIACRKDAKEIPGGSKTTFTTDLERDANSAELSKLISKDPDWIALKRINYEFFSVLVNSDIPSGNFQNKASEKLNSQVYITKLKEAQRLASNLRNKYFQNTKVCVDCETMTEAKWKLFQEKIISFRSNKEEYKTALGKLGFTVQDNSNTLQKVKQDEISDVVDSGGGDGCNNWRFYLCGTACTLGAPAPPIFAACLLMCIAQFC